MAQTKIDRTQQVNTDAHRIFRYWGTPATGSVYSVGDNNYSMDTTGYINGVTWDGTKATITRSGLYSLGISIQCIDVAQAFIGYFDAIIPSGWGGASSSLSVPLGYQNNYVVTVPVGGRNQWFGTVYLPAGATITPRISHRGSSNTRVGGDRNVAYWFIEQVA